MNLLVTYILYYIHTNDVLSIVVDIPYRAIVRTTRWRNMTKSLSLTDIWRNITDSWSTGTESRPTAGALGPTVRGTMTYSWQFICPIVGQEPPIVRGTWSTVGGTWLTLGGPTVGSLYVLQLDKNFQWWYISLIVHLVFVGDMGKPLK